MGLGSSRAKCKEAPLSRIIVVGQGYAGKSTLMDQLRRQEVKSPDPTARFNLERLPVYGDSDFIVWEVGGRSSVLALLRLYLEGARGIIFMVDSSDRDHVKSAAGYLEATMMEEQVRQVPLLVLANKMDLPDAMPLEEVRTTLRLDCVSQPCGVFATNAATFEGVAEAIGWLTEQIASGSENGADGGPKGKTGEAVVVANGGHRKLGHLTAGFLPKTLRKFLFA